MSVSPEPVEVLAMGCADNSCDFKPMRMQRRPVGQEDVLFDLKYCGVCHTDLHIAANHKIFLSDTVYPCIPGHELAGVVTQVGAKVTKFQVGDYVGVGCWVDSCMKCAQCKAGREHMCSKQATLTYGGKDKHGRAGVMAPQQVTMGGYSTKMVVHQHFGIKIPKSYPLEAAGPLFCAGVTVYDPMKEFGVQSGTKVGVIGLGGLGLLALQLAKVLGAEVTAISRGTKKEAMARENGATGYISSTDPKQMADAAGTLDLILDTIPANHDIKAYQKLVRSRGSLTFLGMHEKTLGVFICKMACSCCGTGKLNASGTGSILRTQEVIELCDKHNIVPRIEVRPVKDLNKIMEDLDKGNDGGTRYVLDIENTLNEAAFQECGAPPPELDPNHKPVSACSAVCYCCKLACCRCCC